MKAVYIAVAGMVVVGIVAADTDTVAGIAAAGTESETRRILRHPELSFDLPTGPNENCND